MYPNDFENPTATRGGRLDAHAYMIPYADKRTACNGVKAASPFYHLLSGDWSFTYYEKYADLPGFSPAFSSRAKGMLLSPLMTSLELTGIYFPYTGESNVNTLYPTYDLCYTVAHEMSHQRGIMRENEANFMAFLLCYTSDDPYLKYSAAMNIYSYVAGALNATDRDRFLEIYSRLTDGPRADFSASRAVAEQYENELLAEISERVNDWFLKSNGTPGVVSYGMVVRLAVAYLAE